MYEIFIDGDIDLCQGGVLRAWWCYQTKKIYIAQSGSFSVWDRHQCTRAEALLILTALKAQLEKENGL